MLQNVDSRVTTIEGNVITQGVRDTTGDTPKGNLLLQNAKGETVATVTGLEDYALKDQTVTVDDDGNAVFKVTDRYDPSKSYDVKLDGLVTEAGMATANNLKVEADNDGDGNNGNWTITDASKPEGQQTFTNTTLDVANSTSTPIGESGEKYGQNFTIYDTAGNAVKIKDIASAEVLKNVDTRLTSTEGDVDVINGTLAGAVMYDKNGDSYNKESVTLGGKEYNKETKQGGTHLTNVAYATGNIGSEAVNVDYLNDNAADLIAGNNNLKVSIDSDNDGNKDNWTITDTQQDGIVFKNTTLDVANSTSTPIGESGEKYGQNFTIYDTAGNAVKIKDIASAEKLIEVDKTAQEAQTEAEKHSSVSVGDNLSVTESENTNGGIDYQVTLNPVVRLDGNESDNNKIILDGNNGTISVTNTVKKGQGQGPGRTTTNEFTFDNEGATFTNTIEKGYHDPITSTTNINGGTITTDTVKGLDNTTWNKDIAKAVAENEDLQGIAATQGQLQTVDSKVNAGWIATDSQNHEVNITPDNNKLNFAGDENVTVTAANNEIKVALKDDIVLGDYLNGDDGVLIGGSSGTISATNSITVGEDQGLIIDGQKKEIQGLSNTTWNEKIANDAAVEGSTAASTAATQGQLQEVSKVANAGWTASDGTNSISVKPNETLTFVGDENLTVSADGTDKKLKVSLNDNITLGDGQSAITLNGSPQNSDDPALSVGTDKFVVAQDGSLSVSDKFNVDAETGNIYAANNSGSAIMMNDDSVALNAGGNGIVASDEGILLNTNGINEDIKLVTKGTSVSVDSNGTTFTNTNTNETTNINGGTINVGDKLMVEEDGSIYATNNNGSTVMINDNGVALNSEGNGVVVSGEGITLNTNGSAVTVDRFNGTTFTNTNTGETTNINGGTITTNTVKGLSNTTWDDELAKQVANSEELQGTAATQGQLQQAVSEVAEVANAGWNAKAGGNTINVKPNETLNFEGDGNITVSATGGTSNELKFGLNDDITLGNPKAGNTEGERSFTINTTNPEGYVPESYKTGSGADFIDENGGFMLFATNTQGYGVFGVTAKGSAWAKDFKTYTTDIYGNNTQYSLNDVGDAVAQMSSYYNKENGKSYTVFSRYLNEAEKDNPFATVDENATRDIPLALRDDGAVLIGATIKGDDFTDNGIRINAETETTYDGDGNEVTNNIATITGLENTEWKPPTPVATFAANDINTTSRAATEAQLDDLYSAVAAYDVNVDGTIDYSHIALAGAPYGASRAGNGTPTGGTSITNVAYASGNDGSEAVNVDYLNNAIKDAVKDGPVASNEKHLDTSKTYTPDKTTGTITINEVDGTGAVTGNQLVINDVASKAELDSLKTNVGDLNYDKVTGDKLVNGDSVTTAIGKLDNKIDNISGTATNADNNTVTGGTIKDDGTISLTQKDGDTVALDGKLTDSGVVQDGTKFDGETGTLTITSQDKYNKGTSSVTVSGIASKDDIGTVKDTIGATSKEDLKDAYKDADKDGNATTEYITDSESMVEADVALDHAIQDVAGTSYANDMVLSNRIDSVEKRLGNVEERIDKVGAMAAAIANLRTMGFDPEAPTEIAIGVGQYKSETGIAIGVFHYPNQDFMLSASLSSSGDELMGGIGATWKLGRKSAAERAKDEEARHLEQAEEMKKLAQQEKVKAQAQRHAKLLAERQQASQKNA